MFSCWSSWSSKECAHANNLLLLINLCNCTSAACALLAPLHGSAVRQRAPNHLHQPTCNQAGQEWSTWPGVVRNQPGCSVLNGT